MRRRFVLVGLITALVVAVAFGGEHGSVHAAISATVGGSSGGLGAVSAREAVSVLPARWATGGSAADPKSQVAADTSCAENSVLLFSARGSGDLYGAPFAKN